MIIDYSYLGIYTASIEPQSISINSVVTNQPRPNRQNNYLRRFACPVGFFRLKRYCYYLSAGMDTWREAHFNCKDRNATLAVLDKRGKDRVLRKYLMGDQFSKFEFFFIFLKMIDFIQHMHDFLLFLLAGELDLFIHFT